MTTVSAVTVNCRSRLTPRWPARAARLAKLLARTDASFIGEQENYATLRPVLTRALAKREPKLRVAGVNRGKVLRYRTDRYRIVTGSVRRYSLGHGKHAVAALFESRAYPGLFIAVCSAHLINGGRANRGKRANEARVLETYLTRDYAQYTSHLLVLMDNNDAMNLFTDKKPFQLRDAANDLSAGARRNNRFNTYHGFDKKPPTSAHHIDKIMRSKSLRTYSWAILVEPGPPSQRSSDHYPVLARLQIRSRLS